MNLRPFTRPLRAASAALVLLLAVGASAQTVDDKPDVKSEVVQKVSEIINRRAYVPGVDFLQWSKYLEEVQPKIDGAKDDTEFQIAMNTALTKFGTSHMVLFTPKQADQRRTGSTVGVGITTMPTEDLSGLVVIRTVKDAPADEPASFPATRLSQWTATRSKASKAFPAKKAPTSSFR